jgi:hypothetical protein
MPNWCENELRVSGHPDHVDEFYLDNKTDDEELSLKQSVAAPESLDYDKEWYQWNLNNWGTKWDLKDVRMDKFEAEIVYYFDSAWSPPEEWLQCVANKYPLLQFHMQFSEGGCDFWGVREYDGGELVHSEDESLSEHAWRICGEELLDEVLFFLHNYYKNGFDLAEANKLEKWESEFSEVIEDHVQNSEHENAWVLTNDLMSAVADKMREMLKAISKIKRVFRKAVAVRKLQKSQVNGEIEELAYVPPIPGSLGILQQGGFLYREGLARFDK